MIRLEHTLWWRAVCKDVLRPKWRPGPLMVEKFEEALEERARRIDEEILSRISRRQTIR